MDKTRRLTRCIALLLALVALSAASARAAETDAPPEKDLIAILKSNADGGAKGIACKQLAVHGTADAVPALATLLADPELASWARIALEAIPGPAADEALRKGLSTLKGNLLIGDINSIGVRRDAAAVEPLVGHLKDTNAEVASAAAVALGQIGNAAATTALRGALPAAPAGVRSAVAEGCILCAEHRLAEGQDAQAAEIYDLVRSADLPKQRIIEATRGAILARKAKGIPLLVEQLRSQDKGLFFIGLTTARELHNQPVADALASEVARTSPERAIVLLSVLGDSGSPTVPPAVLEVMKSGPKEVRIAAIGAVGQLGDAASLSTLLTLAADDD
ncbi:MAG TPA: HEAT repeat domain-containing protein, partial [Pirellulales bacterium]